MNKGCTSFHTFFLTPHQMCSSHMPMRTQRYCMRGLDTSNIDIFKILENKTSFKDFQASIFQRDMQGMDCWEECKAQVWQGEGKKACLSAWIDPFKFDRTYSHTLLWKSQGMS